MRLALQGVARSHQDSLPSTGYKHDARKTEEFP
jgi:hypothetical protein